MDLLIACSFSNCIGFLFSMKAPRKRGGPDHTRMVSTFRPRIF
jgi:hypothetical protein